MTLDYIANFMSRLVSTISTVGIVDIIDMLILAFIIYKGIKIVRETKAQQLITGVVIIVGIYLVSSAFELKVMSFLLENFLQIGILAIVIVFQPELRRALERIGQGKVKSLKIINDTHSDNAYQHWSSAIDAIGEAVSQLSDTTTGALIVIEREIRLGDQIDTGTILDCIPSVSTLGTIFFPKTPLHDGAVIIEGRRIVAAKCILPVTQSDVPKEYGTRHRSAIGVSELTDAVVVVVSEETGGLSIVKSGQIKNNIDPQKFAGALKKALGQK